MAKSEFNDASVKKENKKQLSANDISRGHEIAKNSEYGSLESNNNSKNKQSKATKLTYTMIIAAAAGTVTIGGITIKVQDSNNSEIDISQVGESYISFNYKTKDNNLNLRLHNDFESKEASVDYSTKDADGYYVGYYTFDSLKPNTYYEVSLDGEGFIGKTAKVSKGARTLSRSYYGEFMIDDSNIASNGYVSFQITKLNITYSDSEQLSFTMKDENNVDLVQSFIYDKASSILDRHSILVGSNASNKHGYYYFEINCKDTRIEIYRQMFSYGEIKL